MKTQGRKLPKQQYIETNGSKLKIGIFKQKVPFVYSIIIPELKAKREGSPTSTERRQEKVTHKEIEIRFLVRRQDCCVNISMIYSPLL